MLKKIYEFLKSKSVQSNALYSVPYLWVWEGQEIKKSDTRPVMVNPFEFFEKKIERIMEFSKPNLRYDQPFSAIKPIENGPFLSYPREWIQNCYMYGFFVRMTTAYNHKGYWRFMAYRARVPPNDTVAYTQGSSSSTYTEDGTFLKGIALLLHLKRMGIDTVYSLPITKYSHQFKKGELPSPYSVKNYLEVEPSYKDSLLTGFTVEEEFCAFVEAAHILGMRVILDFVPRTCARDNDVILEHPDWFYWLKAEYAGEYRAPSIEGLGFCQPSLENLEKIYASTETKRMLQYFSKSPDQVDSQKWENFKKSHTDNSDFLEDLVKTFGILPPPGFSDWVNDNQPAWSDVTFLKLFHKPPNASRAFVSASQPPYVLFDIIKASNFENDSPNQELWEYLTQIIPSYQKRFGIDGIRLDMGHALPRALEISILQKAREIDSEFVFIAEELELSNDNKALDHGYDAFLGNSWWMEPRVEEGKCFDFCQNLLPELKLPVLATAETPDTPRAVTRTHQHRFAKFSFLLNLFLPNGISFLNSGFEIGEMQPMNLGLDNIETGRFVLAKNDPMYAKLAFFDHYALHWDQPDLEILTLVCSAASLKTEYQSWCKNENRLDGFFTLSEKIIAHLYKNPTENQGLVLLANTDFQNGSWISVDVSTIPDFKVGNVKREYDNYYKSNHYLDIENGYLHVYLQAGEATILTIR